MTNSIRSNFQAHPYHLVSPSPWPLNTSTSLLAVTLSAILSFQSFSIGLNILLFALLSLILSMSLWFRDVISEGTYLGNHTLAVQRGLNMGVGFIYSIWSFIFFSYILSFLP